MGKAIFCPAWWPDFNPLEPWRRREPTSAKLSSDLRVCTKADECPHPFQTLITITKKNVLLLKSLYRGRQKQYLLLLLSPNDKLRHNSSKIHSGEPVSLLGFLTEHKWGVTYRGVFLPQKASPESLCPVQMEHPLSFCGLYTVAPP